MTHRISMTNGSKLDGRAVSKSTLVGRPFANALRGIDAGELADAVMNAAGKRALELSKAVGVTAMGPTCTPPPLAVDVRWLIGAATGDNDIWRGGAQSRVDAIEDMLCGVDVPEAFALVLAAARARLTLDAGRAIELAPLAALAGVSLATVRGAVLSGALKAPKGAHGRVVRVKTKDARAWLATRGVT